MHKTPWFLSGRHRKVEHRRHGGQSTTSRTTRQHDERATKIRRITGKRVQSCIGQQMRERDEDRKGFGHDELGESAQRRGMARREIVQERGPLGCIPVLAVGLGLTTLCVLQLAVIEEGLGLDRYKSSQLRKGIYIERGRPERSFR